MHRISFAKERLKHSTELKQHLLISSRRMERKRKTVFFRVWISNKDEGDYYLFFLFILCVKLNKTKAKMQGEAILIRTGTNAKTLETWAKWRLSDGKIANKFSLVSFIRLVFFIFIPRQKNKKCKRKINIPLTWTLAIGWCGITWILFFFLRGDHWAGSGLHLTTGWW